MKKILITGVAGTGKSTIADFLKTKGYSTCDLETIEGLFSWVNMETKEKVNVSNKDDLGERAKLKWICDKEQLIELLKKENAPITFYAGIMSNADEVFNLFDQVVVLRVVNSELKKRLTERTSNDFAKTEEAQDKILSWKEWWEEKMIQKGAIAVGGNGDVESTAEKIIKIITEPLIDSPYPDVLHRGG